MPLMFLFRCLSDHKAEHYFEGNFTGRNSGQKSRIFKPLFWLHSLPGIVQSTTVKLCVNFTIDSCSVKLTSSKTMMHLLVFNCLGQLSYMMIY